MLLRLKRYSAFIFKRFMSTLELEGRGLTYENKIITAKYMATGQTVLFFNQSIADMDFEEWLKSDEVPITYQLKINHCLTLLIDSHRWASHSLNMELESFPEKSLFTIDLDNFKIEEDDSGKDGLTKQFFDVCSTLHEKCPQNTRLRESLIRLIWSYLTAKDLTAQARDLSAVDRIAYLKRLTLY